MKKLQHKGEAVGFDGISDPVTPPAGIQSPVKGVVVFFQQPVWIRKYGVSTDQFSSCADVPVKAAMVSLLPELMPSRRNTLHMVIQKIFTSSRKQT